MVRGTGKAGLGYMPLTENGVVHIVGSLRYPNSRQRPLPSWFQYRGALGAHVLAGRYFAFRLEAN